MNSTRNVVTKYEFQIQSDKLNALEKQLNTIKRAAESIAVIQIAEFFATASEKAYELGKAAFESLEKTAELGERIHIAAESAGLSAEAFQKLAFSAKQNSVSSEEMEHGMLRLSRALYAARNGGAEAQKSFALAGITPDQVQGFKTSQDALYALSNRFQQIHDPIQKAAIAQQLMGRGSLHMVAWMNQGSGALRAQGAEAQRVGAVLTSSQINVLVKLNHELVKVQAVVQAMSAQFAVKFAPAVQIVAEDFLKFMEAIKGLTSSSTDGWINSMIYGLGYLYGIIKALTKDFLGLGKVSFGEGLLNFLDMLSQKLNKFLGVQNIMAKISDFLSSAGAAAWGSSGPQEGDQRLRTALGMQKQYGTPLSPQLKGLLALKEQEQPGYTDRMVNSLHVTVNLNAPHGASASDVGQAVAEHTTKHWDKMMRGTNAGVARGKVY